VGLAEYIELAAQRIWGSDSGIGWGDREEAEIGGDASRGLGPPWDPGQLVRDARRSRVGGGQGVRGLGVKVGGGVGVCVARITAAAQAR
jgi:hypothetical protein